MLLCDVWPFRSSEDFANAGLGWKNMYDGGFGDVSRVRHVGPSLVRFVGLSSAHLLT